MNKREPAGKTDIIRAAVKIFARKGYEAASVDEIAAKAKVAKGTIYYHFATKQEIFLTIIEQGIATFAALLKERIDSQTDPKAQLTEFISVQVDFFHEYKDFCRVLLTEMWRLETHWQKELLRLRQNYNPIAIGILEEGKNKKVFKSSIDTNIIATAVFNMIAITSIEIPMIYSTLPISTLKQQLTDMILSGIIVEG